jgi:hypothetical protein
MYKVSLNQDLSIANVFDTNVYLDESVTTYPITDNEFQEIYQSGQNQLWQYKNGKVVESEFAPEILKNEFNQQQKQRRQIAYQRESDPIFMKFQRGEATKEEWEAKIAEIVALYPYQE